MHVATRDDQCGGALTTRPCRLQTDRVAVDISKSSSLTGFVSGYRKATIALVEAIFRHTALTHDVRTPPTNSPPSVV